MKKVLLTGATGFIGSQVTAELLRRGYEVHALVYPPLSSAPNGLIPHEMNLLDSAAVEDFLARNNFENLIHLAWYVGPKCHVSNLNMEWIVASLNLLQSFQRHGGQKMSFTTLPEFFAGKTASLSNGREFSTSTVRAKSRSA